MKNAVWHKGAKSAIYPVYIDQNYIFLYSFYLCVQRHEKDLRQFLNPTYNLKKVHFLLV